MIRDFSLVFLLLISDRRNLHRDSRRDTEQNVPWWVMMMTACVSFQGLKAHIYCVVGDDDGRMCVISGPQSSSLLCRGWWWWPHVCHFRASKLIFIVSWVMMMTACVSFQGTKAHLYGIKAHLYCVVGDDADCLCVISGPQSSSLLCRGWWWWPHVCHFRASKLIFIVSWVMMLTACVSFQGLKAHLYCVVGDDADRMCVISGPQSSYLLCRGWWWWPHVCHFRASKLIFIVSWVMMMTACVSFQGIKAHLYCVVGDDADCLCVISGPQSSSLLCRGWWWWPHVCHFRASKLIFIVSWVMMMTACVSFQGLKAHLYCVVGDDGDRMCVISGPQSSYLLCRGWWWWPHVCHFRASKLIFMASKLIFIVSWVMMLTACVSFQGLKAHLYCVVGDDDDRMCVISGPQSSSLLCRGWWCWPHVCHFRASKLIFIVSWVMMMTACVSFQGLKAHIYCVVGDDDDRMCVISGPQSSSLLCRGWWWWPHVCHFRASKLIFIVSWVMMLTACVSFQGLKAHLYCVVGDDDDRMCVISGPQSSYLLCRGWWWWPHVCHFRASKLIFIVSWVMMMTACVSFQGIKAHLYCVVGDDADCLCVISGPQSSSLLCRGWWWWPHVCHFRASKLIFIVSWVMMMAACVSFQGLKAHLYCVVGDDDDRMCVISGPQSSYLLCRGWWWWPHVCHFRASKLIFIVSWVMMMTACVSFQGLKAHIYCVVGDDDDRMCVISGHQSSSLLCRGWWCWLPVCHFRASKLIFIVSWVMMMTACVSFQGIKAHLYCVVGDDADCLCVISGPQSSSLLCRGWWWWPHVCHFRASKLIFIVS